MQGFRSRKPRAYADDEGYTGGTKRKTMVDGAGTSRGAQDATQATPAARHQPPVAPLSPEETWRPLGLPADIEPAGARSTEASPVGKPRGSGSSKTPKRQRKELPAQRQLTLLELSERASSPGKGTRSVQIALKHAERAQGGTPAIPKLAGEATKLMGRIKADIYIKEAGADKGRGLFSANGFEEGAIITRYDGVRRVISDPGLENYSKTHMLRIPQSQNLIDGRPLALRLEKSRDHSGRWWPRVPKDWEAGFGCLANSATTAEANARMVFLPDETGHKRPAGEKTIPKALLDVLPRVPFLIAKRRIEPDEEILWKYQVAFDNYELS